MNIVCGRGHPVHYGRRGLPSHSGSWAQIRVATVTKLSCAASVY